MSRSKQKQERYDRLNKRYGQKYGIDGRSVAHIRSAVITGGKTREELIGILNEKIAKGEETIETITTRNRTYADTRNWLEHCNDSEFADITNPKPGKEEYGEDTSTQES